VRERRFRIPFTAQPSLVFVAYGSPGLPSLTSMSSNCSGQLGVGISLWNVYVSEVRKLTPIVARFSILMFNFGHVMTFCRGNASDAQPITVKLTTDSSSSTSVLSSVVSNSFWCLLVMLSWSTSRCVLYVYIIL
jgi:hypothetical protein